MGRNAMYSEDEIEKLFRDYCLKKSTDRRFYSVAEFCKDKSLSYQVIRNGFMAIKTRENTTKDRSENSTAISSIPADPGRGSREGKRWIYVDGNNVIIEARRVSAVKRKLSISMSRAIYDHVVDSNYYLDYGNFAKLLKLGKEPARLSIFITNGNNKSILPEDMESAGFDVSIHRQNAAGHEKGLDMALGTQMVRDALKRIDRKIDSIVLVAGDSDYVPAVEVLKEEGFNVGVVFWGQASDYLTQAACSFLNIDAYLMKIGYIHTSLNPSN
jgi:uncharacterized LabA/DUF88 family protein